MRTRTQYFHAVVFAALLGGVGVHVPTGQEQPADQTPRFRVRTDLVQLDISVLDQQGLPVRGLGTTDFTVLEDGVPQPVVAFAAVEVPTWSAGTAAWMREVGPDVVSNRLDARRAVVIVLDDFKTRWDPGVTRVAKSIAGATIDRLGPADLGAVVYVLGRDRGQEFTLDRTRLRAAVERFVPSGLGPASESRFSASAPSDGRPPQSQVLTRAPSGACIQDCVAMALRNAAEILGSWPGARKTVVLISPGQQAGGLTEYLSNRDERARMFAALQEANVNVYQFDPHGLQAGPQPFSDFGTLAENTGGRATTNTNAPADFVPQMFRENSSYYLLGLRPATGRRDGRFHRLEVQVNRPGVHVRARAGYYAATDRPPAASKRPMSAVDRALSGGLPAGDLPVSVTVAPFATAGKPGAVLAVVARLDHEADFAPGTVVEFTTLAFDDKWKQVAAVTQRFTPPPTNDRVRFSETATRLNLPPGRYEVRVAMSTADDRTGSVFASVAVPNFAREPLSLSGVVIQRPSGGAAMPEDLATVAPARISTDRMFQAGDRVAVVVRVYQGRAKTLAPVRVTARIVDGQDRIASTTETTIEPTAFGAQRQADYRLDLPLDRLAAGDYLLTLDVSTATTSARRDLRFTVRR